MNAPFGILMRRADHLREIDDYWFACVAFNEDIEFVVITMD